MQALTIKKNTWRSLIRNLRKRGNNRRESGAFLLGKPNTTLISHFVCYDDLDPKCLNTGIIIFDGSTLTQLWEYCSKNDLTVLADVHTHPRSWTGQSEADRTHPMISSVGHMAFILPWFAQRSKSSLYGSSAYKYLGDHKWANIASISNAIQISDKWNLKKILRKIHLIG